MSYVVRLLQVSGQDTSSLDEAKSSENWSKYKYRARTCNTNRSFFTTKRGFMGLGSNALLPDDVVCVLFGAIVPLFFDLDKGIISLFIMLMCMGLWMVKLLGNGKLVNWKNGCSRYAEG